MEAIAWSPAPGARRLLFTQERAGIERPAIWDLDTRERVDLDSTTWTGPAIPQGWTPDGARVLVHNDPGHGRQSSPHGRPGLRIGRGGRPTEGTIYEAGFRRRRALVPGGLERRASFGSGRRRATMLSAADRPTATGHPEPLAHVEQSLGRPDHRIPHDPAGSGPFPTIASIHGGPEWHHTDLWDPGLQAFVDEGFAVLQVNYRGSTGRGKAFREELKGNIGFPETEDIVAGIDHVVAQGIADPTALFLEGLVMGRIPHHVDRGPASRPVAGGLRGDPGRRLRGLPLRVRADAPCVGRRDAWADRRWISRSSTASGTR